MRSRNRQKEFLQSILVIVISISIICFILIAIGTAGASESDPEKPAHEPTSETQGFEVSTLIFKPVNPVSESSSASQPEEAEQQFVLDIPLAHEIQLFIFEECTRYDSDIDPFIVFAMIWKESSYRANAVGDGGNSIGLMQIQERWHRERMEKLDCSDLYNPIQNIRIGINILDELIAYYDGNVEMALMAYNAGQAGANRYWFSKGHYTNAYSQSVLEKAEELRCLTEK